MPRRKFNGRRTCPHVEPPLTTAGYCKLCKRENDKVRRTALRVGPPRMSASDEKKSMARKIYDRTGSTEKAAAEVGYSSETVRHWVTIRKRSNSERLLDKTQPEPNTGCWIWRGAVGSTGYGTAWLDGRFHQAHRAVFIAVRGPIPAGLELDHLCRNPSCVNPDHLEAVTHAENMKRGRFGSATHCPHGHEYNKANTRYTAKGHRQCRPCSMAQSRARYVPKKDRP